MKKANYFPQAVRKIYKRPQLLPNKAIASLSDLYLSAPITFLKPNFRASLDLFSKSETWRSSPNKPTSAIATDFPKAIFLKLEKTERQIPKSAAGSDSLSPPATLT